MTVVALWIMRLSLLGVNYAGFARNYFLSISYSCTKSQRFTACHHCVNLRSSLNSETIKICIKKEDLPDEFVSIEINRYISRQTLFFSIQRKKAKLTFLLISLKLCEYFLYFKYQRKVGDGCVWGWFCFFLPVFCFWCPACNRKVFNELWDWWLS